MYSEFFLEFYRQNYQKKQDFGVLNISILRPKKPKMVIQ